MLIQVVKIAKQREARKKSEVYSAGQDNPLMYSKNLPDVRRAIESKLKDYTVFTDQTNRGFLILDGGNVPDHVYNAVLVDNKQSEVKLKLIQKYDQPGPRLYYAEVEMRYDSEVEEADLEIIRSALIKSGLEKVVKK